MLKGITQHGLLPILGLAFKIGLFIVTAINTYGILYLVSQDRVWAAAGLILFEVGLIYWWLVFKNDTGASVIQMAISLMMFITCLLLVAAANALHLGAVSPDVLGQGTIPKVIIIAVVVQLAASLIYSLASQEHMAALVNQIALGLIWAKAQANVMSNLDRLAEQTQAEIEDRMWQTIQSSVRQTANDRLLTSSGDRPTVIEGQSLQVARRPSWRDRLFGRNAAPPASVSNITHGGEGPGPSAAAAPAGQGARTPVYANLSHLTPDQLRQMAADLEAGRAASLNPNGQEVPPSRP